MDIQMPVMDGLEATLAIRNELELKTPIIALSANALKTDIEKWINAGMNDYLTKPFEEKDLIKTIEIHLEKKSKHRSPKLQKQIHTPLYDLSAIEKLSNNNPTFVRHLSELFINQIKDSIGAMNESILTGEVEKIKKIAHKLKPTLLNFKVAGIENEIRIIETYPANSIISVELKNAVNTLIDKLNQTAQKLSEELKRK
jgi:two-component system, sensor histidine kinase